ncbi:MAG: carbon starvation protein A [Bacteroidaceae bacterium]|nr:carbon starvation protein A [Bacteroidaceae bacterium]
MISFSVALVALLVGYLVYGTLVERVFGIEPERKTPAYTKTDGVDYTPMPQWKVFLIQFLNIAGTGPIFGAIMGIQFGPAAYLWIVLGCIFIGGFHDYMSGMISLRKDGLSLPEVLGDELGNGVRHLMRLLSMLLLVLVGTVFVVTPADLLAQMTDNLQFSIFNMQFGMTPLLWFFIILLYYMLATMLPISALIGRLYPLFGISLLMMALLACYGIYTLDGSVPELTDGLSGHHPAGLPVFPMLCITIACGAVSGFHGTQSPIMSRCLKSERDGRRVFYGAMITEGVVALIWAAAAIKYAGSYEHLAELGTPAVVVHMVCNTWFGRVGAILAVLGVVAAPITSGDTAFRSARLIVADMLHINQRKFFNRFLIAIPMFAIAVGLRFLDFNVLWRYFAWTNQTLACATLWAVTVWMARRKKCYWMGFLPALFMTAVCTTYIFTAPEGFQLPVHFSLAIGMVITLASAVAFYIWIRNYKPYKN